MEKRYLNPFLFFLLTNGKFTVWDYKNHNQFQLENEYLERLVHISEDADSISSLDEELLQGQLVFKTKPKVPIWGWDDLSKIFHFGTQNVPLSHNIENYSEHFLEYLNYCEQVKETAPPMNTEKEGQLFHLPEPNIADFEETSLWTALKNRKTCRAFNGEKVSLEKLSSLLYATFGRLHNNWNDLEAYGISEFSFRKSSPSVGGIHSSEAYVFALNVENLERGVYHYQSHNHKLRLISPVDYSSKINEILCGQNFADKLSIGIAITSRLEKCWHKYKHSRAFHAILLDVGHLSQTFQLCTTALKLNPWLTGIFSDKLLMEILKLEDTSEYPLFFIGAGLGEAHSLSLEMRSLLQENEK